mgnify:CR=1 FL=1
MSTEEDIDHMKVVAVDFLYQVAQHPSPLQAFHSQKTQNRVLGVGLAYLVDCLGQERSGPRRNVKTLGSFHVEMPVDKFRPAVGRYGISTFSDKIVKEAADELFPSHSETHS